MIRLGHLVDSDLAWDQRVAISQLIDRLPSDRFAQHVGALGSVPRLTAAPLNVAPTVLSNLGTSAILNGTIVGRFADLRGLDLWHAWSAHAGACAVATGKPVVLDVTDPALDRRTIKRIRALAECPRFAVSCSSQIVRRRLIEGGVPLDRTVVVRPGIDFAAINHHRRSDVRHELGIARDDFVVICPERLSRSDGHLDACLATSMLGFAHGKLKLILPGSSPEQRRIERLCSALPMDRAVFCPRDRYPTEQLIAVADALVMVPRGDIATTAIAWAMASETVVIGTATYAVAELISSRVNGLLFKQTPGRRMVTDVAKLLQTRELHAKLRETARGQAYEVFSLRRYAEQTTRLYDNLREGRALDTGITDPAMVA